MTIELHNEANLETTSYKKDRIHFIRRIFTKCFCMLLHRTTEDNDAEGSSYIRFQTDSFNTDSNLVTGAIHS